MSDRPAHGVTEGPPLLPDPQAAGDLAETLHGDREPGAAGVAVGAASPGAAFGVAVAPSAAGLLALATVPLTPPRRDLDTAPGIGAAVGSLAMAASRMPRR